MKKQDLPLNSKGKVHKDEKGFTLVEIMVAVCVLSIGLLAIASMQLGAVSANARAIDTSEASTVAELQMETLLSLQYRFSLVQDNQNHLDLQDTNADGTAGLLNPFPNDNPIFDTANLAGWLGVNPPDHQRTESTDKYAYTIYWNVATDAEINDTKTIHVIVTWADKEAGHKVAIRRVIPRIS
jgi:type IV pilus assembly protein PilV